MMPSVPLVGSPKIAVRTSAALICLPKNVTALGPVVSVLNGTVVTNLTERRSGSLNISPNMWISINASSTLPSLAILA